MKTHNPNLEEFIGGYFHQDWQEDAPTATGIVQRYLAEWPAHEIALAAQELQVLLSAATDDELFSALKELGSYYDPTADGLSGRAWLERVLEMLRAA